MIKIIDIAKNKADYDIMLSLIKGQIDEYC